MKTTKSQMIIHSVGKHPEIVCVKATFCRCPVVLVSFRGGPWELYALDGGMEHFAGYLTTAAACKLDWAVRAHCASPLFASLADHPPTGERT